MNNDQSQPCLLATNLSQMDTSMITALLEDAGIPSFIKDHGSGGYMKLYMGYTIYGSDIYVGPEAYDKSKELMDIYFSSETESIEFLPEDIILEEPENKEIKDLSAINSSFKGATVAKIIITLFVLTAIIAMILNKL